MSTSLMSLPGVLFNVTMDPFCSQRCSPPSRYHIAGMEARRRLRGGNAL
jgi:hypothetical protein